MPAASVKSLHRPICNIRNTMLSIGLASLSFRAPASLVWSRSGELRSAVRCSAVPSKEVSTTAAEVEGRVVPTAQPRTLTPEQELDELYDTLERYDTRLQTTEAQLRLTELDMEQAVQKTGAFWIAKIAEAKVNAAGKATEAAAAALEKAEARAVAAEARAQAAEMASTTQAEAMGAELRTLLGRLEGAAAPPQQEAKAAEAKVAESKAAAAPMAPEEPGKKEAAPEAKPAAEQDEKQKPVAKVAEVKKVEKKDAPKKDAPKKAETKDAPKAAEVPTAAEAPATVANEAIPAAAVATVEPSLPPMKERYAAAQVEGQFEHIAQYEVYEGMPVHLKDAMSQLPDEAPLTSPKHSNGPRMSLGELRVALGKLDLPTTGLRTELETRYDYAMRLDRTKTMNWDPSTQSWVPVPSPASLPDAYFSRVQLPRTVE